MTNADLLHRQLVRAAVAAPYLEREEEHQLALRWRDHRDEKALHQITAAHMRLAISIAARFRHYGLPISDLVQEGHIGLMEAAARFEPERDVRFSTYASWWIRASIQEYVLRNWSIVRGGTSSAQKSLFFNLRRLKAQLGREFPDDNQRELTARISETLGVSVKDVQTMDARFSAPDTSMNAPISDEDGSASFGDLIPDTAPRPDDVVEESMDGSRRKAWLAAALRALSDRELHILRQRRLIEDPATLEAIGADMGISKERVRQLESRALDKLKRALVAINPRLIPGANFTSAQEPVV
ncbi:MAG: RNA polymerase factor sigma-32 [Beijerinckiaceae bacterium]